MLKFHTSYNNTSIKLKINNEHLGLPMPLYHNRTHAVTEANASIAYLVLK